MTKQEITNQEIYDKLEEIRVLIRTGIATYKLLNSKAIEDAQEKMLKVDVRKKIFDNCDGKKVVTQIAQAVFPNEPVEKSMPKVSYHLAILEDYGLVKSRDVKGSRYYSKKRE
ncbi:MAG: ArsR/SmtB family transcription factor [Bacillota bacterium]